ncbi:MAG: SRPBCC family protein [Saprospiraceae bacterium]|nr:SRPBCC family protein [Saprospiraceae bacterium]
MRILKILGFVILGVIALILIAGLILPKDYEVSRDVVIDAPASFVFKHVASLKAVNAWAPWGDKDPNQTVTYEGEDGAVGSTQHWSGNDDVGEGIQTITAVEENRRVDSHLKFIRPWESESDAYITLDTTEAGTRVTWGFKGTTPFPMNAMGLFMNMDKMLGAEFEKGLNKLKELVDADALAPTYDGYAIQTVDLEPRTYLAHRETVAWKDFPAFFAIHMPGIYRTAMSAGATMAGAPAGLYFEWDEVNEQADMATAVPVASAVTVKGASVVELPATKAKVIEYYGSYSGTGAAHGAMDAYFHEFGLEGSAPVIEEYVTDPSNEPDTAKWLTRIIYPIK